MDHERSADPSVAPQAEDMAAADAQDAGVFTPEESQRRLMAASQEYMHGELTLEHYMEAIRSYGVDYGAAFLAAARRRSGR